MLIYNIPLRPVCDPFETISICLNCHIPLAHFFLNAKMARNSPPSSL